jgi:hypothetical protein
MKKTWIVLAVCLWVMNAVVAWAVPTQVKDLTATATGPNTGRIEGTAPAGTMLEVDLRISTTSIIALKWSIYTRISVTVPASGRFSFPASGLNPATAYFTDVKFRDASGWSIMSNQAIFTTLDSKVKKTFVWDPNSETDLSGYKLYCGATSRSYTIIQDVRLTQTPGTPFAEIIFDRGVTYFCAATAYDNEGFESSFSNEVTFTAT